MPVLRRWECPREHGVRMGAKAREAVRSGGEPFVCGSTDTNHPAGFCQARPVLVTYVPEKPLRDLPYNTEAIEAAHRAYMRGDMTDALREALRVVLDTR